MLGVQTVPAININAENGSWALYQQAWAQADSQVATGMINLKDAKGTVFPQPSIPQAHRWLSLPRLTVMGSQAACGCLLQAGVKTRFPGGSLAPTWRAAGVV